jgi:hypothetical protein
MTVNGLVEIGFLKTRPNSLRRQLSFSLVFRIGITLDLTSPSKKAEQLLFLLPEQI